jgi:hypothetical protein
MLEDLQPPKRKQYPCNVDRLLESLEGVDRESLEEALNDKGWTASALSRELTRRGLPLTDKAIKKHRWGECGCSVKV